MARLETVISIEMDAVNDAIADLQHVHQALAKCHGDVFRKLDRRIDDFLEDIPDCIDIHWKGGFVAAFPKGELTEILREARQLGIIR